MSKLTLDEIDAHLTPDLEQYINSEVASGRYQSAGEMICEALTQLKAGDEAYLRFRNEVRARLARIDRGEGIVLKDETALEEFFEDIERRGRLRYEFHKRAAIEMS